MQINEIKCKAQINNGQTTSYRTLTNQTFRIQIILVRTFCAKFDILLSRMKLITDVRCVKFTLN